MCARVHRARVHAHTHKEMSAEFVFLSKNDLD